jgi:hypothetical protein
MPIDSLSALQGVSGTGYLANTKPATTDGSAFASVLGGAIDNVQGLQSTPFV